MGADDLAVTSTPIPGLLVVTLPVHRDHRGWFKENWQREKMVALGLPDFGPVQNNMSFNARRGATRGIHTEPWDKFVSVATGRVFAAWVDMRAGESFGATFSIELGPETAVYVPRGVGNSYQALEDGTLYSYLVNDHWRPGLAYPALHLADETAAIDWPIPLDAPEVEISEKDHHNPRLDEVTPVAPRRTLILGGGGQLGRALAAAFPDAEVADRATLDVADPAALAAWPWAEYDTILNAAAHTAVDAAEEPEGRRAAWAANAAAPAALARIADEHGLTLVHYSTDYVFDGEPRDGGHAEDDPVAPLGVYGQSKAAGDLAVTGARRHYVLRTSWVIGEGGNFVRTMRRLAEGGVSPTVVADQVGRLTFTAELARATKHLLETRPAYGVYNVTNGGAPQSWAQIAARVFELSGRSADDVTPVSTEEYGAGRSMAPRPRFSVLSLEKITATGFEPVDAGEALEAYLAE
ncbi:NAD-dependent epimerase/dehydratase family protein [Nocardioides sp. GY 10113]|uniref:sugar nucleotide-binding protein n=1 Tax=Nocardioides sp. GY 10113 TaxID=2569761 RepID=UPI0010A76AE0|nr:bifunctional dTDP-4-dehydrorhamnose 3,5-epimerase family protein/NAD(P)-dependent oxidoreductase [Nocardioides sp. GY 10113]TIC88399.1 NAD-dependent epimerase/dehydratase family protein [Nocardioides sp. GY 10113]